MRWPIAFMLGISAGGTPLSAGVTATTMTATARATIVHPVTLKPAVRGVTLLQDDPHAPTVVARETDRPCRNGPPDRCRTILFDLP